MTFNDAFDALLAAEMRSPLVPGLPRRWLVAPDVYAGLQAGNPHGDPSGFLELTWEGVEIVRSEWLAPGQVIRDVTDLDYLRPDPNVRWVPEDDPIPGSERYLEYLQASVPVPPAEPLTATALDGLLRQVYSHEPDAPPPWWSQGPSALARFLWGPRPQDLAEHRQRSLSRAVRESNNVAIIERIVERSILEAERDSP